jgi:hypothetical protein
MWEIVVPCTTNYGGGAESLPPRYMVTQSISIRYDADCENRFLGLLY